MENEYDVEWSPLCQELSEGGKSVEVYIYRSDAGGWILEIVDKFGNSTVWEDEFTTDTAALDEAKTAVRYEGIDSFIGSHRKPSTPVSSSCLV